MGLLALVKNLIGSEEIVNYNRDEVLKNVEQGDLSFLVRNKKFRTKEEQIIAGNNQLWKILKLSSRIGIAPDEAYYCLVKSGIADNNDTAEKIMDIINGRRLYTVDYPVAFSSKESYFSLTKKMNSHGEVYYECDHHISSNTDFY